MRLNGWRGGGLLIMAVASLFRGWRYAIDLPHRLPPGIAELSFAGQAIRLLGVLWFAAALLGIWSAFRPRDRLGIFALAFMHALWAAALALGWLLFGGTLIPAVSTTGVFGLIVCWSRMVNPPRPHMGELPDSDRGASE